MALLRTSFRTLSPNLFLLVLILAVNIPVTRAVVAFSPSSTFTTTSRLSRSPLLPQPQTGDLFLPAPPPPPPPPSSSSSPFAQSAGSTLPLPFNNPVAYSSNNRVQWHQKVSSTAPESLGIHLLHSCSNSQNKHSNKNNIRNGYVHHQHHTHRRSMPYSDQDVIMDSQTGQQQQRQEQQPQEWSQPSGTAFAEGLPLWTPGTASRRPFRHPFVKSFGLRHKATMDWGMRARARTQKHWDKYWDQLENPQASGFDNLYDTGTARAVGIGTNFNSETGAIIADATCTDARIGTRIVGAGGPGGDNNNKGLPGEENMSSYPEMIPDDHGASASTPFASVSYASSAPFVPALNCTHNSNLDSNIDSCNTSYTDASSSITSSETMLTAITTATAIKDNGLARAEAEPPKVPPDYISPPLGDNDGPGSLFFSQLLNHYEKPPSSFPIAPTTNKDPASTRDFSSPFDNIINSGNNNNGATHTNATFRQYYQINREFYKSGGPIILWLPGESPLHSLFLRRGLAYELANATAGLLVALEHRFYGNSIPRFQDSPVSHQAGPIIFDAGRGKQESPSSTSSPPPLPDPMLSDPDSATPHMMESPTTKEGREEGEEGEREIQGDEGGEDTCMAKALSSSSPTSPNSSPTKFNHLITVDKVSGAIIKGEKHKGIPKGDKEQLPLDPHDQTDKVNDNNNDNNDNNNNGSTAGGEKEGLPLDLLKYLNVDQSIEDIARFMDLFPSLQPKLFLENESSNDPLKATAPTKPRWILAGCSYGGNLAAWTRQRYPSKVFAAFASSAPVRSALDFFEYSTSQIDILGDKCSSQLGHARDFLDSALGMTDEFMQQMAVVDLEVEEQNTGGVNTSGVLPFAVATGQEHERLETDTNSDIAHLSTLSPFSAPTTDPASAVGSDNDDKARRQAAKLRVLTWFSPDFAHEYAAEGEEIHAAGWIWWTVASAVQYNAVVTPATVQPVKTAVDILCDAMDLTKIDDLLRSNSPHSDVSNSNLQSKLRLQYTKALASWFKDQQYFTPTKQEDLQPADLDPTSVQSLAGMAWLWQTCSELGYLQTAHPSTCCCPSLSKPTPSVQSTYDSIIIKDFSNSNDQHRTGSSNATCPLISGDDNNSSQETFHSTEESFFLTRTTTPESASATTGAGSSCLPCRCYADKAHKSESVFSRLLTLEAAWQECQFYFSSTHPPARNLITKPPHSSCSSTSPSPLSSLWSLKETTDWNISTQQQQQPPGSVDVDPNSTYPQRQQSGPGSGDILPLVTPIINSGTATQQQQQSDPTTAAITRDEVLLMGYPDVETNVNTKFHGWEIAQDPCYSSGSTVDHEIGLKGGDSGEGGAGDAEDTYLQSDEIQFASSSTATIVDEELGTVGQEEDDEDEEDDNEEEDKVVTSQSGTTPRIASELDDWLMDHPGGRYYFTNGEKDPWKELTLASSRAIEFLRRPKVGGGSGNGYRNGDAGNGDNNGSGRRVYLNNSLQDQVEGLLKSVESLESAPLTGQSARKGWTRHNTAGIIKEEEDSLVGKKLSLSQDATFGMLLSNSLTYRHHHKATRHRSHHRRRHHPQKHHHHHHHHKHHSPRKHTRKHRPRHRLPPRPPPCAPSTIDPCPPFPFHTPNSGGSGSVENRLSRPKVSDQDENDNVTGSDGPGVVVVVDKNTHEDVKDEGNTDGSVSGSGGGGSGQIGEEEFGDRTVMRIISEASHCQDILYESNDLHSVKLRAEREHVLRTFVRWIEIDNRRQQRVLERQQQQQQQ